MAIPEFLRVAGIDRSKLYELIDEGVLSSVLIGRRRLIIVQSYFDYLRRQQKDQASGAGRIASPNPRAGTKPASRPEAGASRDISADQRIRPAAESQRARTR
jgi:hypothetical protein